MCHGIERTICAVKTGTIVVGLKQRNIQPIKLGNRAKESIYSLLDKFLLDILASETGSTSWGNRISSGMRRRKKKREKAFSFVRL